MPTPGKSDHAADSPSRGGGGRRAHARVRLTRPVRCTIHGETERTGEALLTSLTPDSARLDMPHEIVMPATVGLVIDPGPGGEPPHPIELEGRVIWTVAEAEDGRWPTGVAFTGLSADCRKDLIAFIATVVS